MRQNVLMHKTKKVRPLQHSLAAERQFFIRGNISKASGNLAMLIVKHGSPFTEVFKVCYENRKKKTMCTCDKSE